MGKVIVLLLLLGFTTFIFGQGSSVVSHNIVYFVSNDTIIEGTEVFCDDGYFDVTNLKYDSYEYGDIHTNVISSNIDGRVYNKKVVHKNVFNETRIDTIQYPFEKYQCKDVGIMNTPDIVISTVLYKYAYINSIFTHEQKESPIVRIIEPLNVLEASSEYNDISVFFDNEDISSFKIVKKHAMSINEKGLILDKTDTITSVSKMNVRYFKRLYKKINIAELDTEIDASYNPYFLAVGGKNTLVSPVNADRRFKKYSLSRLIYFLSQLAKQSN